MSVLVRVNEVVLPGLRVLIVDSDEAFTGRLSKTLHTQGVITTVASNGADAITVSLSQAFDLIVLDAALPKIDGLTIIQ